MTIVSPMPVLGEAELDSVEERLATADVRLLTGSMVDMAGVARAKQVPLRRARAFHVAGMGASPTWNVFCIDNQIAFTPMLGVVGDLRLRADLAACRLPGDGLAWAPTEVFTQDGEPSPLCPRGLLRATQASVQARGLDALVGCELEMVLTQTDGSALSPSRWSAYGLGPVLDREAFLTDLVDACQDVGMPLEQIHAEYGDDQYEVSLPPTDPLTAADNVVLARLLAGRLARRHGLGVSFSPLPFAEGVGNGAHQHLSISRGGTPLLSGGEGPHGLTGEGAAAIAGIVAGLPDVLGVLAGSVLSARRLVPGHWSGPFACWGLENREAAVRLCADTRGNPHGANVEIKCVDPSANPYLSTAVILGLALDGLSRGAALPPGVDRDPATQSSTEAARTGTIRLASDQRQALDALASSPLARRLLGSAILEALLAVRRHEQDSYGKEDIAVLTDTFRFTWSL